MSPFWSAAVWTAFVIAGLELALHKPTDALVLVLWGLFAHTMALRARIKRLERGE